VTQKYEHVRILLRTMSSGIFRSCSSADPLKPSPSDVTTDRQAVCTGVEPLSGLVTEDRLNNIYEFSPYLKENTTLHHYKDQLVNAV
jgi:hypothetical protein